MDYQTFLRLAVASGLLRPADLPAIRRAYAEVRDRVATDGERISSFMKYLVERGLLTQWQCSKLVEGRYKGFFVGRYKLLDRSGGIESKQEYVAENTETGDVVEMHFIREDDTVRIAITRNGVFVEEAFVQRTRKGGHSDLRRVP
jgi:hypothetical protein